MLIRQELATDLDAIEAIHLAAFASSYPDGEPVEAALVRALRTDPGWVPALSLVAEDRADGSGVVVGHVVCTVGTVDATPALGLGPLGVLPDRQTAGVGSALVHAVIGAADALGYPVVVLLGHPGYYPRFGFGPASALGIEPTEPAWGDHFQARRLAAWTPELRGTFRYAAPFDDL
jgi:putative acetyltransferase